MASKKALKALKSIAGTDYLTGLISVSRHRQNQPRAVSRHSAGEAVAFHYKCSTTEFWTALHSR